MKKLFIYTSIALLSINAFATDLVFDSMDKATEVKLAPAITTTKPTNSVTIPAITSNVTSNTTTSNVRNVTTSSYQTPTIKEQKFVTAIDNLDDAQVELRQELTVIKTKYTTALAEKEKAIEKCKALKKEIKAIDKKMKNIDKSKKMINKNLQPAQ